jgi:hypothetical protein
MAAFANDLGRAAADSPKRQAKPSAGRFTKPDLAGRTGTEDADLRVVARFALGNIGDADSADALLKTAEGKPSYERDQATDACLRLARALGEEGKAADAEKICRKLMDMRKAEDEVHERCAALACLAEALGVKVLGDVHEALQSKDLWLRNATARTAVDVARAIAKDHAAEAKKLLEKVLESTEEEAVHEEAHVLLLELEG